MNESSLNPSSISLIHCHFPPLNFIVLASVLIWVLPSCDILTPGGNSETESRVLRLSPDRIVATEHFASSPDSISEDGWTYLSYTIPQKARDVLMNGSFLDCVMNIEPGSLFGSVEGWNTQSNKWEILLHRLRNEGENPKDIWWNWRWGYWTYGDPLLAQNRSYLVAEDGSVRLRSKIISNPNLCIIRVVELEPGVVVSAMNTSNAALASVGGNIAKLGGLEFGMDLYDSEGRFIKSIASTGTAFSFCQMDDYFYGVITHEIASYSEIIRLPIEGGFWEPVARLPWFDKGDAAVASDGFCLYLIRYPETESPDSFPTLYWLSVNSLENSAEFSYSLRETTEIRIMNLSGGVESGFAWWPREKLLVAPGYRDGEYGLIAFDRRGHYEKFIPLPFEPRGIKFAFLSSYIFLTGITPTLESIGWSSSYKPKVPKPSLMFRWNLPTDTSFLGVVEK